MARRDLTLLFDALRTDAEDEGTARIEGPRSQGEDAELIRRPRAAEHFDLICDHVPLRRLFPVVPPNRRAPGLRCEGAQSLSLIPTVLCRSRAQRPFHAELCSKHA
jgi:hypothetical protein